LIYNTLTIFTKTPNDTASGLNKLIWAAILKAEQVIAEHIFLQIMSDKDLARFLKHLSTRKTLPFLEAKQLQCAQ